MIPLPDITNRSLRNLYERISNFGLKENTEDNLFQQSSKNWALILPTFPTQKLTDNIYYYNILKDKGLVRRKVTFG